MARAEPNSNVRMCSTQRAGVEADPVVLTTRNIVATDFVRAVNAGPELTRAPISVRGSPSPGRGRRVNTANTSVNGSNTQFIGRPATDRTELSRPIVFGNSARYFGFTRDDDHTHEWTLYVRPYRNSHDLGQYIKKVIFVLDPYYPNEEVFQSPFEIKRTGWGEFDIDIKLVFRHRSMRTLTLRHYLRLVEYDGPDQTPIYTSHIQSESYDEIVISLPPAKIKALPNRDEAPVAAVSTRGCSATATNRNKSWKGRADPAMVLLPASQQAPTLPLAAAAAPAGTSTSEVAEVPVSSEPHPVKTQQSCIHLPENDDTKLDQHAARRLIQLTNIFKGKKRVLAEIHRVKGLLLKNHQEIRALLLLMASQSSSSTTTQTSTSENEYPNTQQE